MGVWRCLIVPPWSVRTSGRQSRMRRHQHVQSVSHPGWSDWSPLIIIGNRKSGNSDCDKILSMFRRILNPCQVIDLEEKPPIVALQWAPILSKALQQGNLFSKCSRLDNNIPVTEYTTEPEEDSDLSCRLLVAGGDGTIAWILNVIHNMGLKVSTLITPISKVHSRAKNLAENFLYYNL